MSELHALVSQHSESLDASHIATSLVHLRVLWRKQASPLKPPTLPLKPPALPLQPPALLLQPPTLALQELEDLICRLAMPLIGPKLGAGRQLADVLHAIARLPPNNAPAVRACVDALVSASKPLLHYAFGPLNLSIIAWALASLNHHDAEFMDALIASAARQLHSFKAHELANILWALAKLSLRRPTFVDALLDAAQRHLPCCPTDALASFAWALASLDLDRPAFMDALVASAQPRLPGCSPEVLAGLAWALARLRDSRPAFMDALLAAAAPVLPSFTPQQLASTVWAVAVLGHVRPAFMSALVAATQQQLPSLSAQELGSTAWALAVCGVLGAPAVAVLEAAVAVAGLDGVNPVMVVPGPSVVAPSAVAGPSDPLPAAVPGPSVVAPAAVAGPSDSPPVAVPGPSVVAPAAVAGPSDPHPLAVVPGPSVVAPTELVQLHQLAAALADAGSPVVAPAGSPLQGLLARCSEAARAEQVADTSGPEELEPPSFPRQLHDSCMQLVESEAGAGCRVLGAGQVTEDGLFRIDVVMQVPLLQPPGSSCSGGGDVLQPGSSSSSMRVAVLAAGPSYYTRSKPHRPLGATSLRSRFLEHRGWRVLLVPFYEFEKVDVAARPAYLLDGLAVLQPAYAQDGQAGLANSEEAGL